MKNFLPAQVRPFIEAFFSTKRGGNRHRFLMVLWAGLISAHFSTAFSQTVNWGENTDLWRVRGMTGYDLPNNTGLWHSDSLWIGATFIRDSAHKFIVWRAHYYNPQGSYHGALYLMVPRVGRPDSALFLFYNRCNEAETPPVPDSIDPTNNAFVQGAINHLDTLFFMYLSWQINRGGGTCPPASPFRPLTADSNIDANLRQDDSLFTGPNRAPGEGWTSIDRHYSSRNINSLATPHIPTTFFSLNRQKSVSYGRRWCSAGWVHTVRGGAIRTDTVEFGFEDQFNGDDMNYEDIRFNVTGVFLLRPVMLDTLLLDFFPRRDTVQAGDSISYRARNRERTGTDAAGKGPAPG